MSLLELKRSLTLLDATMINIGSMIGSGIFLVPAAIALALPSSSMITWAWIIGGIISMFGAFAVAELGSIMPHAGGQYVYLREAYSPLWGFLYGWASFGVITSASISAVAVGFATYIGYFIPLTTLGVNSIAILSIVFLTVVNCLGVKSGAFVQNAFTFIKIAALLILVVVSFTVSASPQTTTVAGSVLPTNLFSAFGIALISILWTYDGWIEITYVGSEVKNPNRNMPFSIIISTSIVVVLYLLVNTAYQHVLPLSVISQSSFVASDAATALIGPIGATLITLGVIISTFGCNNGFVFTGARIMYAMAKEGLFFKSMAAIHPKFETPVNSLIIQGVWSSLLVLTGTYNQLITYVIFASWIFYSMSAGAVLILRKRHPNIHRSFKTWGYPVTPILFILTCLFLVVNTIIEAPRDALVGAGIIILGIPAYYFWKRNAPVIESNLTTIPLNNNTKD